MYVYIYTNIIWGEKGFHKPNIKAEMSMVAIKCFPGFPFFHPL